MVYPRYGFEESYCSPIKSVTLHHLVKVDEPVSGEQLISQHLRRIRLTKLAMIITALTKAKAVHRKGVIEFLKAKRDCRWDPVLKKRFLWYSWSLSAVGESNPIATTVHYTGETRNLDSETQSGKEPHKSGAARSRTRSYRPALNKNITDFFYISTMYQRANILWRPWEVVENEEFTITNNVIGDKNRDWSGWISQDISAEVTQ